MAEHEQSHFCEQYHSVHTPLTAGHGTMGAVPPWYDTHVHIDRYDASERGAISERAGAANVLYLGVATDLESSRALTGVPEAWRIAVGVHPTRAHDLDVGLADLARASGVVAIGECGFDASGPPTEFQARAFRAQCALARGLNLALVLHVDGEGAWELLLEHADACEGLRLVRHYFTGDANQAAWHQERGHYLSFGNPLRRRTDLRDIAREYPADRLLIETDSYPLPARNTEPCHVALIGETLALVRDWTFEQARQILAENTLRAFATTA